MNEEDIVGAFLENGFQISRGALRMISEDPRAIIFELKKINPRPFIITEQHIKKVLENISNKQISIKIIRKYTISQTPVHISDYIKTLSSRYEKIKSLLLKQMAPKKLMSINKITPRTTPFSIIGVIRKKNDNSVLIEDLTGEMTLYFDETTIGELENMLLDDVVGIQCEKIKEKYYVKKLFYPDILSSREINKTEDEMEIAIASIPKKVSSTNQKNFINHLSTSNPLSLFLFSNFSVPPLCASSRLKIIQITPNDPPQLLQLGGIKILVIPKLFFGEALSQTSPLETFISILKRRELFPISSPVPHAYENFVLDETPDIIISDFVESFYQNYKGTTIISNSNPQKIFFVNLKTREAREILI